MRSSPIVMGRRAPRPPIAGLSRGNPGPVADRIVAARGTIDVSRKNKETTA